MRYILNGIYLVLLLIYLPLIAFQRIVKGKKRPGLWGKIIGRGPRLSGTKPRVLFHAVSLGEVNAIRTLVKKYQQLHPEVDIVVSTTTQTGFDAANKSFEGIEVCLLPFDFSWAVSRFLKHLRPEKVILAELEIWPNLVAECKRKSIELVLVNGRLSESSFNKYRRLSFLFRRILASFDAVCCQNECYADRFAKLGVETEKICVTGNLKYDNLLRDRFNRQSNQFRELVNVGENEKVFLAGSTQAPEESIAIKAYLKLKEQYPSLLFFLCPRHPERFDEVATLLDEFNIKFTRRSFLSEEKINEVDIHPVVLLDSMGELQHWWGTANIAFVGGSFGNRGGQNMVEPVAFGANVCFGPNTKNFASEVQSLLEFEAAKQLNAPSELFEFLQRCLDDEQFSNWQSENTQRFIDSQTMQETKAWQMTIQVIDSPKSAEPHKGKKLAA